ncbi:MAG: alpha/beta hydrolase [Cytophagia bacterium]|nr:alpha/beta hydrolase [Cytophagia bacterium]
MIKHLWFLLLLCSLAVNAQTNAKLLQKNEFSIGETLTISSNILSESRTINIYLPDSYKTNSENTYPVIYLLDGSRDEDFIHIAGLVQFGSFSWINLLPESIVVGIANVDRQRDFTFPTQNQQDMKDIPTSGQSEKFMRFLEQELQPFISSNYRTSEVQTLIGQSLGGLLATEILFKNPDMFDNYIIVSPSLWWNDESLLNLKPKEDTSEKSIYIAVGKEGEVMERTARELYELLKAQNKDESLIYFDFLEDKDHGDALHLAVYHAFEKIFKQSYD